MKELDSRKMERGYYVEGNTARKLNTVPERVERPEREERRVNEKHVRNTRRARAFDLKYTVALVVATVFLFSSCVSMLTLQAQISEQRREIAIMESNLNNLADANNETSKRLDSSVDLREVYEVATKELGMEHPKNGQVVSYEASNPDYVKQFKDVPAE
ncbi:MAG: hypothetical protein NC300_00170 [Bacteroidales bacterium]|nr:hypothetical protein [Clostridium sp.]MCM1202537.1 hypothetical protein [Bacteroidales bacterium]